MQPLTLLRLHSVNLHEPFSLRKTANDDGRSEDGNGSDEAEFEERKLDGRDESHNEEEPKCIGFGSDASGGSKGPTEADEGSEVDEKREGVAERPGQGEATITE